MSYVTLTSARFQYTLVSRETKEHTFHVKLQPWTLGDPAAPARRLEDEVVKIARRDAWDAGGLRE